VGRWKNGAFSPACGLTVRPGGGLNFEKQKTRLGQAASLAGLTLAGALSCPATAVPGTAAAHRPAHHSSGTRGREWARWV